jgi:hypothetical protein
MEISQMEESCDLILPWWYLTKHVPSGFWENNMKLDSEWCKLNCTKHKSETFPIEYDSDLLDIDLANQVGVIGMVTVNDGKVEVEWAAKVPERYREYAKVFSPEQASQLPPHRSFDHATDIKEGAQPPWGPIYALSETELAALKEYLNEMLKAGKIRPSKSPAGAPILFVPKPHG